MVSTERPLSAAAGEIAPAAESLCRVVREPLRTCRTCATPVDGFDMCWRCRQHQRIAGVANVVAPLIYAIPGTDSAALVRNNKNHPRRIERDRCARAIGVLLSRAVSMHEHCFGAMAGISVSRRAVVPSLTSRPGIHPLLGIAGDRGLVEEPILVAALDALCDRVVAADKFVAPSPPSVAGRHVLVIDDVWTTGSNAQSAAVTLHRAGAAAVSVLVVARWLDPRNTVTARFIRDRPLPSYDPAVCPVTGSRCP